MIPIPPSHCVSDRHIKMPWLSVPGSGAMEAPVVVKPAAVSKKASVNEVISPVRR